MSGGKAGIGETELRNLVGWRTGVDSLGRPVRVPIARDCDRCPGREAVRYWHAGGWLCTDCRVAAAAQEKAYGLVA